MESLIAKIKPSTEGLLSAEKIFDRANAARSTATKQGNRFWLLSLVFSLLYLLKLAGIRLDLAFLDTKVSEIPYGLSVFVVAANVSSALALIRFCDARGSERTIAALAKALWPDQSRAAFATMTNEEEWLTASSEALLFVTKTGFSRWIYNLTIGLTLLPLLTMVLLPSACAIWFLFHWNSQILTGNQDLQFWLACAALLFNALWIAAYVALNILTETTPEE